MVSKHLFGKEPVSTVGFTDFIQSLSSLLPFLLFLQLLLFFYSLKMKKPTGLTKNRPEAGFGPQAIFGSSWWKGRCLSYLNFYQDFFSAITLSREYLKHFNWTSRNKFFTLSRILQIPGCGGHGATPLRSNAVGSTLNWPTFRKPSVSTASFMLRPHLPQAVFSQWVSMAEILRKPTTARHGYSHDGWLGVRVPISLA